MADAEREPLILSPPLLPRPQWPLARPAPAPGTTPAAPGALPADEVVVHWTTFADCLKEELVLAARPAGDQLASGFHADRLLSTTLNDTTTTTYSVNAAGNLLSRVGGTVNDSFAYDEANRLTGSTVSGSPSIIASYAYNDDGLRTSKTVGTSATRHLWDPTQAVPATPAE